MSQQPGRNEEMNSSNHLRCLSPFVLEFEYGALAEGYWTYDSMVLQLDDCADVVKTLYPHQYDLLFLLTTLAVTIECQMTHCEWKG
jgi:hypothetical protein